MYHWQEVNWCSIYGKQFGDLAEKGPVTCDLLCFLDTFFFFRHYHSRNAFSIFKGHSLNGFSTFSNCQLSLNVTWLCQVLSISIMISQYHAIIQKSSQVCPLKSIKTVSDTATRGQRNTVDKKTKRKLMIPHFISLL